MIISKTSAVELLDKLDNIDEKHNVISYVGGFSKIIQLNKFMNQLQVVDAEDFDHEIISVDDDLYQMFAEKILDWKIQN